MTEEQRADIKLGRNMTSYKQPSLPRIPIEPKAPPKMLYNNRQCLGVDITGSSLVAIPLEELLKVRSKINAPDESVSLVVTSCVDCDGTEVNSVYFEWYDSVEDPKYKKNLKIIKSSYKNIMIKNLPTKIIYSSIKKM